MKGIEKEKPSFDFNGYISSGIYFTCLSFSLWLSSGIIAKTSSKFAMIIGTIFRLIHMSAFFTTQNIWFYLAAVAIGFGDSLLWTGLANYVFLNSEIGKMYFGIGVFWTFYQFSHFFGRMMIHFKFNHSDVPQEVGTGIRSLCTLMGFVLIGILMLIGIQRPLRSENEKEIVRSPCNEVLKTSKLLITPRTLLLTATMITVGVNSTFANLLSHRIGFSTKLLKNFENPDLFCGIVRVFGGILGAALSIVVGGRRIRKLGPLISLALVCSLTCYLVAFLGVPDGSAQFYTDDLPIVLLPSWIIVIAAAMSGMGDAFLHIGMYDILGAVYPNESASAFAVFKFIRGIAVAASSYYGWRLGLHVQIVILMVLIVLSWLSFTFVDWFTVKTTSVSENQSERRASNNNPICWMFCCDLCY